MGVTVVRGTATPQSGSSGSSSTSAPTQSSVSAPVQASTGINIIASAIANARSVIGGEAAISHIRATKFSSTTEKLRDYSKAESDAKDIAAKIRGEGDAMQAHGELNSVLAKEHLAA